MEWLKISTSTELVRVATEEIVYVRADGNYSDLVLANGTTHKMTFQLHYFEEYFSRLHDNTFIRVGRSLIVNRRHVRMINIPEKLLRFGGHTISPDIAPLRLGRDSLKELKNAMVNYE